MDKETFTFWGIVVCILCPVIPLAIVGIAIGMAIMTVVMGVAATAFDAARGMPKSKGRRT